MLPFRNKIRSSLYSNSTTLVVLSDVTPLAILHQQNLTTVLVEGRWPTTEYHMTSTPSCTMTSTRKYRCGLFLPNFHMNLCYLVLLFTQQSCNCNSSEKEHNLTNNSTKSLSRGSQVGKKSCRAVKFLFFNSGLPYITKNLKFLGPG